MNMFEYHMWYSIDIMIVIPDDYVYDLYIYRNYFAKQFRYIFAYYFKIICNINIIFINIE